jgi:hypothetical protein
MNPNVTSTSSSVKAWEYASASYPLNVAVDPGDATVRLGPVQWWQTIAAGTVVFKDGTGTSVTFTGLAAGDAFAIQALEITSAPGDVRVGWGGTP